MFQKKENRFDLEKRLIDGLKGEEIQFEELEALCGIFRQKPPCPLYALFHRTSSAVEKATDGDLCWRWKREDNCIRCLTEEEKVHDMGFRTDKSHRASKRNTRIGSSIVIDELSPIARTKALIQIAVSGAMAGLSSRKSARKLTKVVDKVFTPHPDTLLEAMQRRKNPGDSQDS